MPSEQPASALSDKRRLTATCGCEWTPGIDLPTAECDGHRDDPSLAHREPPGLCCAECNTRYPEGAVHESCAEERIRAEGVPFHG